MTDIPGGLDDPLGIGALVARVGECQVVALDPAPEQSSAVAGEGIEPERELGGIGDAVLVRVGLRSGDQWILRVEAGGGPAPVGVFIATERPPAAALVPGIPRSALIDDAERSPEPVGDRVPGIVIVEVEDGEAETGDLQPQALATVAEGA